jgi:hypothetical protein
MHRYRNFSHLNRVPLNILNKDILRRRGFSPPRRIMGSLRLRRESLRRSGHREVVVRSVFLGGIR